MPYNPKAIANHFLDRADREGVPLSPMKIQKLIYYANGWCLAIKGRPLIDEQVEAWRFGPVIRSIYREFQEFGNRAITRKATEFVREDGPDIDEAHWISVVPSIEDDPDEAGFTRTLLDRVWEIYGGYTAIQLSNMTHAEGTPWYQVTSQYGGTPLKGTDIPIETMREHFSSLFAARDARS